MKHFWLIRHAKTADAAPGGDDFERELTAKGQDHGSRMAAYLKRCASDENHRAQWLVTSAAVRARQTSEHVAEAFEVSNDHCIEDPSLYLAPPQQLLESLRETPDDIGCTAIVAHNPGLTWLVNALVRGDQQIDNLPTMGCVLFRSEIDHWADLIQADLVSLMTPKMLKAT